MKHPRGDRLPEVILDTADTINSFAHELCCTVLRLTEGEARFHELREEVEGALVNLERDQVWSDEIRRKWLFVPDTAPIFEAATGSSGGRKETPNNIVGVVLTTNQAKTMMHAIAKAKRHFATDLDAIALEHICAAFVGGTP